MEDLDNNRSIPLLRGPANMMVVGPNGANFASSAVRLHPVDRMQRGSFVRTNSILNFLLSTTRDWY